MFNIENTYKIIGSDLAIISDNFHIFHFDEFPILFAGTNRFGTKVIGSLATENEDGDVFRHFHFVVTNKQYNDFVKRKITYRDLIFSTINVFVLDKDINGNVLENYYMPASHLPAEYLPLENIFCPNVERVIGFDYAISLQGAIADVHEAFSSTVSTIGNSASKILNTLGNALKIKLLNPHVHQLPSVEGSFELKFRVKIDNAGVFYKEEYLKNYFQLCLDYSINTLPTEAKQLVLGETSDTVFEKEIIPSAIAVYESLSYKMEESYVEEIISSFVKIVDDIAKIGSQVGKGFNAIEISGFDAENKEVAIGFIDNQYAKEMTDISQEIDTMPRKGEISDDEYKEYRILVYDLNIDTRNGAAHINSLINPDIMDNPKIRIEGNVDLAGSVFTESLHFSKWINVKAKVKLLNERYRLLTISPDV